MSETEKQEGQKTVVSFISGLLIGGLLVWAFSGNPEEKKTPTDNSDDTASEVTKAGSDAPATSETTTNEPAMGGDKGGDTPAMTIGEGKIQVANQSAGMVVKLDGATYPVDEGWIAVRTYPNGQLGSILGAARFSKEQSLVPEKVELLAPTVAGREYAVVFFSEDGNRTFNLDGDTQLDAGMTTFKAE